MMFYYALQSNLQIQRLALLDDEASCAGDHKPKSDFIEGF